jgi:hypothetical protein
MWMRVYWGQLTRHDMVRDINGDFIRGLYGVVVIHVLFAEVMVVRHAFSEGL